MIRVISGSSAPKAVVERRENAGTSRRTMIADDHHRQHSSTAGYSSALSVRRRTAPISRAYATYRRMTVSRLPLRSPAISDAVNIARHELAVLVEGVRQLRAGLHPLVDVVDDRLERRIGDVSAQQIERLHQRHAGLQQRRQLLVELEEVAGPDAPTADQAGRQRRQDAGGPDRQEEQALLLELAAELRLALGGVDAVDELARRACPAYSEIPSQALVRQDISGTFAPASRDYSNRSRAACDGAPDFGRPSAGMAGRARM